MTFDEWYEDMEARYDANYSSEEDLLRECWEAAQKAQKAQEQA
jgi:hypothetical protein